MLITFLLVYFALCAGIGAILGNLGLFGPFPAHGPVGLTALGAALGVAGGAILPFAVVGAVFGL